MAYETFLPLDHEAARNYGISGDMYQAEYDGLVVRPYIGEDTFYEEELSVGSELDDSYDPLTASLDTLVSKEYGSFAAYQEVPTIWDQQAEDAYQEQRAHGEALARTIALQSMKRVAEYRANFPRDTDTLQLRLVEPEPSNVDIALAELRQLRDEIAYEAAHPPIFSHVQTLHTRQYEGNDAAPVACEPAHSGEGYANSITAEPELAGGSTAESGRTRTRFEKLKTLSAHGARKFISRITRQAVLWR